MDKGVFKTIVYYDCLNYPLTNEELAVFSFRNDGEAKDSLIELKSGLHFLKGRERLIKIREERNELVKNKWKKALRAVSFLRAVPYIRLIFGSGSLALGNTDKDSDLDFLIVAEHGRIWTARSLAVFWLNFFGLLRRRGQKTAPDKVCLNHIVTDKSLYIPRKSIYTAQLYARLVPIMGDEKLVEKFIEANSWVGKYVRGWPECLKKNQESRIKNHGIGNLNSKFVIRDSGFKKLFESILNTKLGDWVEAVFRKYNLHRINSFHLTHKPGGRVVADDESLEFHPDSPELKIIERYNSKIKELGFSDLTEKSSFVK